MTLTERKKRMQNFPKNGKYRIYLVLKEANSGIAPINEKTIGCVLRGERGDNHGVIDLFRQITDDVQSRKTAAAKLLSTELDHE